MCGIVGYIGGRQAAPIMIAGLRRLGKPLQGYLDKGLELILVFYSLEVPQHYFAYLVFLGQLDYLPAPLMQCVGDLVMAPSAESVYLPGVSKVHCFSNLLHPYGLQSGYLMVNMSIDILETSTADNVAMTDVGKGYGGQVVQT